MKKRKSLTDKNPSQLKRSGGAADQPSSTPEQIKCKTANLSSLDESEPKNAGKGNTDALQSYWVIVLDRCDYSTFLVYVKSTSHWQACDDALGLTNAENGYAPEDDGGFEATGAYDRADLLGLIAAMDSACCDAS